MVPFLAYFLKPKSISKISGPQWSDDNALREQRKIYQTTARTYNCMPVVISMVFIQIVSRFWQIASHLKLQVYKFATFTFEKLTLEVNLYSLERKTKVLVASRAQSIRHILETTEFFSSQAGSWERKPTLWAFSVFFSQLRRQNRSFKTKAVVNCQKLQWGENQVKKGPIIQQMGSH